MIDPNNPAHLAIVCFVLLAWTGLGEWARWATEQEQKYSEDWWFPILAYGMLNILAVIALAVCIIRLIWTHL